MKSLLLLTALASVGAGLHRHRRHVDTADWLNGEEHSPIFVSMDRDGSKTVTAAEMEAYFKENMPEHVHAVDMLIRAFDRNGDKLINLWEAGDMFKAKKEDDIWERYLWKVLDKDSSGCNTKDEYHTNMMALGMGVELTEKYLAEDFAKYDTDNDDHLRYEGMKALLTDPKDEERKRNFFQAIDKDGDGEITMAEQMMAWEALGGKEMNIDLIHQETMKWDTNKDSKLSFDEFKERP